MVGSWRTFVVIARSNRTSKYSLEIGLRRFLPSFTRKALSTPVSFDRGWTTVLRLAANNFGANAQAASRCRLTFAAGELQHGKKKESLENRDTPLEELSRRFARRLDAALDAMAYPARQLDRQNELAYALGVEILAATTLLSGLALPDYGQLLAICALTERQPGYFLDRQPPGFPEATTIVKPLGPGEPLVIRLPKDMLSPQDAAKGLVYHRAKVPTLGYGIEAGDYLIALKPSERPTAMAKRLYLFYEPTGFAVRRCAEVSSSRAVFYKYSQPEVPFIVPTKTPIAAADSGQFSQLVASLRGGKELHLHN